VVDEQISLAKATENFASVYFYNLSEARVAALTGFTLVLAVVVFVNHLTWIKTEVVVLLLHILQSKVYVLAKINL
jgi:hypothetical protein